MKPLLNIAAPILIALSLLACGQSNTADINSENTQDTPPESRGEVNLYSARHYDNDLVLYEQFTKETGIKVNIIEGNGDALIERLSSEGEASPADLFITADAGILWRAESRDLFQPLNNPNITEAVPAPLQHPEGLWIGLTKRARIIIFNKEKGLPAELTSYEDLANSDYKDMICVRSSSNIYNQSLMASIIAHLGPEAAQQWANGVVANFARPPQGNDTAQIESVAAGQCRLGIVNSYYVARFVGATSGKNKTIGEKIGILFPNQSTEQGGDRGTHVNVSGAGLAKYAPNANNAKALLLFLLREDIQASFAGGNNEYPVRSGIDPTGPISSLEAFQEDQLPMTALGIHQREAVEIFDRAGWK